MDPATTTLDALPARGLEIAGTYDEPDLAQRGRAGMRAEHEGETRLTSRSPQ